MKFRSKLKQDIACLSVAVISAFSMATNAKATEPVKIYAAGSLMAALNDAIAHAGLPAEAFAKPVYGPAGLLRQRVEKGEAADIFLSADLTQPRALAVNEPDIPIIAFALNKMCLYSKQPLGETASALLRTLTKPSFRLASSTPKTDPAGDYAFSVFARADAVKAGASQVLRDKALQLLGSPNAMTPIAGKSPAASIFLSDRADALVYYCSSSSPEISKRLT